MPRFRCKSCRRTFSRQTFRHDYRDRRPECNITLYNLLTSGAGLRQCARKLGLDIHSVQRKFWKVAQTCRLLHRNLCRSLPADRTYLFDEEETYEQSSINRLTMPVMIEGQSFFVISALPGPIRRLAPPGTARRHRQDRAERRRGQRRDRSRRCVAAVLAHLKQLAPTTSRLTLRTDEKASYASLIAATFGRLAVHETTSSRLARGTFNPLHAINLTIAMARDNCGRLRRKSWLTSKKRRYLRAHMHLFIAFRNYERPRRNHDDHTLTPAVELGVLDRPLRPEAILSWRQDWGFRSLHPTAYEPLEAVA